MTPTDLTKMNTDPDLMKEVTDTGTGKMTRRERQEMLDSQRERIQRTRGKTLKGVTHAKTSLALLKMVDRRMKVYRVDALDALHDLAMMETDGKSPGHMQVKLLAARILAFPEGEKAPREIPDAGQNMSDIMRGLKDRYDQAAPRIRQIRERTVTFEDGTTAIASAPIDPQ